MWKCPVCGKKNEAMLCSCGYDESLNYAKYPTLMPIGPVAAPASDKEQTSEEQQQQTQPITPAPRRKKLIWAITAAAAVILSIVLVTIQLTRQAPTASGAALPTRRAMASDCSTVLSSAGHSGAVLELQVQDQELNERFQVLTVTCSVDVWEDGQQKQYEVELLYEYTDNSWHFSTLSNVIQ